MIPDIDIAGTLEQARFIVARASGLLNDRLERYFADRSDVDPPEPDDRQEIETLLETAFLLLLTLTESLHLTHLHGVILTTYENARLQGLTLAHDFESMSSWSVWENPITAFIDTIAALFGLGSSPVSNVRLDLLTVLQNTQNAITDKRCFPEPPKDEADVHDRIEPILRCFFPDLKRKPPIAKSVTNFIPDTGLPSLSTLIEYKFISEENQSAVIANQILSDTLGYAKSGWRNIVFVIYETKRFKTPDEWKQLLRDCGIGDDRQLVLLHGEQPQSKKKRNRP